MISRFSGEVAATPRAVRAELRRILESEGFIRCPRMQRFLEFVVEEYLGGRADQLGEYGIGVSVYDRGPDFEPALDPIVRNDARRLRMKLLEYYRNQKAGDDFVIEIPKGGYVPAFVPVSRPLKTANVRLAILPFDVLTARSDAGQCGRAFCLSLTAGLTNIDGVETVAHSYCGDLPLRQLSSELRLTHLVQGAIIPDRNGLRVVVNLIQLADGTQLWARQFDLGREEFPAVHSDLTNAVAAEVAARLGGRRQPAALAMAA